MGSSPTASTKKSGGLCKRALTIAFYQSTFGCFFFLHGTANGTFEVRIRADGKRFRHNKRRRITHDCRRKISANVEKPLQDALCVTKNSVRMRFFVTRLPCKEYLPAARNATAARRRRRNFALKRKQTSLAISADI